MEGEKHAQWAMPAGWTLTRETSQLLSRHQMRRAQGLPTLGLFVGPFAWAEAAFTRFLHLSGRHTVVVQIGGSDTIERAWFRTWLEELSRYYPLCRLSVQRLAGLLGESPGELSARLSAKSEAERSAFLERIRLAHGNTASIVSLTHWVSQSIRGRSERPWRADGLAPNTPTPIDVEAVEALESLMPLMGHAQAPAGVAEARLVQALDWLPVPLPGLMLRLERPECSLLEALLALTEGAPALPVGAVIDDETRARLFAGPESRSIARLREGLIEYRAERLYRGREGPTNTGPDIQVGSPSAFAFDTRELKTLRVLKRRKPELVADFVAAVEAQYRRAEHEQAHDHERARSLAELLLFRALQAWPRTYGLFELNGKLPFRFGAAAAEIDLLCRELRIAVEVDGYHHFSEAGRYRRDRRKDLLLQKHDYMVVRVLASDVTEALRSTLNLVGDAVRHRERRRRN